MNRRLSTNITFQNETARQDTIDRLYQKTRREIIQAHAFTIHANLKPLEVDTIYENCEVISDHDLSRFRQAVPGVTTAYLETHAEKQTYSALSDWMNDDMNDIEKARREIASWVDNPKIAYFDTETTGLEAPHVPWSAAACNHDGISLLDIRILTLGEKGEMITISPEASRVTGMKPEKIAEFTALEIHEAAIIGLEGLMKGGFILTGYNTQFDRGMICRAISNAAHRQSQAKADIDNCYERLLNLHRYFNAPDHWMETKDTFVRAIGLDPNDTPGRRTRLQDIARATKALTSEENQQHGALADCQLLARIVCNIRKELDEMASKKPAPAKATEETSPEKDLSDYIAALETENEELKSQMETAQANEKNIRTAAVEKVETLETQYNELKKKYELVNDERVNLGNRVRELENLCEQYQQADGIRHHEARELTWCDLEINGFRFNWTIREGEPVEAAVESAFKTVRALQAIRDTEKVRTFRVGLRDNWQPLKGFDKPNGQKPADDTDDVDHRAARGLPPADEKPATPKGTPPAANKPNTPPPAKPATPPQGNQPAQPTGKVQGAKASQLYTGLTRHQIDGQNTYELSFILGNGKPADKPIPVSKRDTPALEKALEAVGWTPDAFELGTSYDVKIMNEWTWGKPTNPDKPEGPRFHDNATFTVQTDEPF